MLEKHIDLLNKAFEERGAVLNGNEDGSLILIVEPTEYVTYDCTFEFSPDESEDVHTFAKALRDLAEYFDPDEQTSLWVGPDGHGKNGAPYRISDILHEFELVEIELRSLSEIATAVEDKIE